MKEKNAFSTPDQDISDQQSFSEFRFFAESNRGEPIKLSWCGGMIEIPQLLVLAIYVLLLVVFSSANIVVFRV